MRNQITKDKEFCIISRDIDNATKCKVVEVREDCFLLKLGSKVKYEQDESVELFAMTQNGQLYFETVVKEVKNDIVCVWFPITHKYLQRREYSRIAVEKEIRLKSLNDEIRSQVIDLSAGGLKLETSLQLELTADYDIQLEIENRSIKCLFSPMRIEVVNDKFIASGYFKNLSGSDKIALVQYCFRKLIENNNK